MATGTSSPWYLEGSYLSVVRMVYGDGYRQAAGTWATDEKIGLGRARVDVAAQVRLRQFKVGWPVGFRRMQPYGSWEPTDSLDILGEASGSNRSPGRRSPGRLGTLPG